MNMKSAQYIAAVIVAAAFLTGCQKQQSSGISINDGFVDDSQPRGIETVFARQAEIGAREDAMLYDACFTGGEINSLGLKKLNLITANAKGTTTVYLNIPKDNQYGARETSVNNYFSRAGINADSYTLVAGPNVNGGTPAAQGLKGLANQSKASGGGSGSMTSTGGK